jgi:hypothetical protein
MFNTQLPIFNQGRLDKKFKMADERFSILEGMPDHKSAIPACPDGQG